MSSIQDIEFKFQSIFGIIERINLNGKGLRMVYLSGDAVEFINEEAIKLIKQALPSDTTLCRMSYDNAILHLVSVQGDFRDRYAIIFCSSAWSQLESGGRIPELEILFHKTDSSINPLSCEIRDMPLTEWPPDHADMSLHLAQSSLSIAALYRMCDEVSKSDKPYVNFELKSIARERINNVKSILEPLMQSNPSNIDYKDTLSVLLDTILDPAATSSNVIAVARELKKNLFPED